MSCIAAVSLLTACVTSESSPAPVTRPIGISGEVVAVTDGDTIDVTTRNGEITVRLIATNAPEADECFYEEALDRLIDSVGGATVSLETVGVDRFDRVLTHVFSGDRHINLDMVSAGMAIANTPDEDDPHRAVMLDAEEEAYAEGRGLWGDTACGANNLAATIAVDEEGSVVDPDGPDDQVLAAEVIRVVNLGDDEVDLTGWIVRDESSRHRYHFPEGLSLAAGAGYEITSADPGWSPGIEPVWNNDGDLVLIQDPAGNVVSRWRY